MSDTNRIATITNQCVAARRPGLIAKFVGDPTISVDQVAAELAKLAVEETEIDGDAIIARQRQEAMSYRAPAERSL